MAESDALRMIRERRAEPFQDPRDASRSLLALHWLVGIPLFLSAFVALPRRLSVGPLSALGALTIVEVSLLALGVAACARYPKRLLVRALPYGCFLSWAAVSPFWAPPIFQGMQNGVVYLLFGCALLLSGTLTARNPSLMEDLIGRGVRWIDWIALTLVLRDVLVNGLPNDPEEGWLVGPRPLAVLGLVMLSWHLSRWYFGSKRSRLLIGLWLLAILASMSRTGMGVGLFLVGLVVLLQARFRPSRTALSLPALLVAASFTVGLVLYSTAFNDRFFGGERTQKIEIAGFQINTSGRINLWGATIASARESPLLGKGLGSSQHLIEGLYQGLGHPHNDYLRVWHDLGVVGLLLLMTTLASWLWILFRAWYKAEKRRQAAAHLELTALLLLLALMLVMVPDNALIYSFIMGPAGILVGSGLGVRGDR
jgi:O-antigen ligase/polysaccharide polymerase Wzy-like membrane protein